MTDLTSGDFFENDTFSMDELDKWTTLVGLVQSVVAFVEKSVPGYTVHLFYHSSESHEYREIDREGVTTFPEDTLFIGCLSMLSGMVSVDRFFSDYHIDDPIVSHFLLNVYNGLFFIPVVHSFEFLAFMLVCKKDEDAAKLGGKELNFLDTLTSRLQINLYAASVADRRQRELLHMTQYPFALQKHNTLHEVFKNLLTDLRPQIDFDIGVCYAFEEETSLLVPFSYEGFEGQPDSLQNGSGISGQVFSWNKSVSVPNRAEHPSYSLIKEEPFIEGSFISVPFGNSKTKLGVITLCRRSNNKNPFGTEHCYMLEIAAAFFASEVTNRQLYKKLDESNFSVVKSLTSALEAKDKYTEGHSDRVKEYAVHIAQNLGYNESQLHQIRYGAMLHDIGKIGIGDAILNKHGGLSDDEFSKIKNHTEIGYRILDNNPFFNDVKDFVRYHHERLDGSGYYGKKEGEYPEGAMVVSCADIFDALTSDRPYRKPLTLEEALTELKKLVGVHYTKKVFDAFEEYVNSEDFKNFYNREGPIA